MTASDPGAEPWRALHPLSVAVNLVPRTWALARGVWPILLVVIVGGDRGPGASNLVDLVLLGGFFMAAIGNTIVHWATLRYRLADGRLELRSGLFNRQRRVFSPKRVQHVEVVRNVFQRAFGLAEVRIETASGDDVEGLLSALSEEEASRLVDALSAARASGPASPDPPDALPLLALRVPSLLLFGATSLRLGWVFVALGLGMEAFTAGADLDTVGVDGLERDLTTATMIAIGLGVVALSWVGGIVGVLVRHHGFVLDRTPDALRLREGLTTTRRVELPLARVQRVTFTASWLRRAVGQGVLSVEAASASAGAGGLSRASLLAPAVPTDALSPLLDVVLEGTPRPGEAMLRPPDPRALRRAVVRAVGITTVLTALAVWRWGLAGGAVSALLPFLVFVARLDHRHQGWALTDELVVARVGYLTRVTTWASLRRVQAVSVVQGPFLRRYGIAEVVVQVAGGSAVSLPLLDADEAWSLATSLSARVGRRAMGADQDSEPSPADDLALDAPIADLGEAEDTEEIG